MIEGIIDKEKFIAEQHKKILDFLGPDVLVGLFSTVLTSSDICCRFLFDEVNKFMELSYDVKYAIVQQANALCLIGNIVRNEIEKRDFKCSEYKWVNGNLPDADNAEEKFITVVKKYYEQLKEDGKL